MKHFLLPVFLIAAVSALLIVTDVSNRPPAAGQPAALPRVAIVQHAAQTALDDGVTGIILGLSRRGFVDGKTVSLEKFNAQGDISTANSIAHQVTDGSFDLVVTSSTVSMQAIANANREGRVRHIFGVVADPASAGIGVSRDDPLDHPPHLAGISSLVSVEKALILAREMNPQLKRLGLVWHTAETNSIAYAEATRAACKKLEIELLEANAENSSAVGEAAGSLVARGLDALLVTADVVVLVGIDSLVAAADRGGIPVLSIVPPNAERGALFDLGNDYTAIGVEVGELAGDVLNGLDVARIPILNKVPVMLALNLNKFQAFSAQWKLPAGLPERARLVVGPDGPRVNSAAKYE